MTTIAQAIKAKQSETQQLQADIDALQRAASIVGGKGAARAAKKRKRRGKLSAAARKVLSQKLKAHWAKKKTAAKPKKTRPSAQDVSGPAQGRGQADEGVLGWEAEGEEVGRTSLQNTSTTPSRGSEQCVSRERPAQGARKAALATE